MMALGGCTWSSHRRITKSRNGGGPVMALGAFRPTPNPARRYRPQWRRAGDGPRSLREENQSRFRTRPQWRRAGDGPRRASIPVLKVPDLMPQWRRAGDGPRSFDRG